MHNIRKKCLILSIICCLIASASFYAAPAAHAATDDTVFKGRVFGDPQKISTPITKAGISGAIVGKEDGRDVYYTVVNAELASFQVVDIKTNALIRQLPMEGTQQAWSYTITPDGSVYVGGIRTSGQTKGHLWKYSPDTKQIVNLGEPIIGEKSIWSLTSDDQGNVYGGTFQAGKVFKYDPKANKFTDYGSMVEGQEYVRSIAYHDGYIYAGTGERGDVIKLGVTSATQGYKQSIAADVPGLLGVNATNMPFAYDMAIVNNYLLVKFTGDLYKMLIYDLQTQKWLPHVIGKDTANGGTGAGVFSFAQLVTKGNKVYLPANGHITELNLDTFEVKLIAPYGTSLRGAGWVKFDNVSGFEGDALVSMKANGDIALINVDTGAVKNMPSALSGSPNPIHNIEVGPDGNLYMSAYPAGMGAVYNPRTGELKNLIMEQAEGMVAFGSDMYLGTYPGGHVEKIDTTKATPVTEKVFTIGEAQDRPYIMQRMEDKIMIGTIPDYGQQGGALTIYDPASGTYEVFRNVVEKQSIVGLAYKDGYIYGSTTVHGGLGLGNTPLEKSAKIFVWDVAKKSKVAEFTLDIPGLSNPPMISGLSVGPDGNIWGGVNGILFKMDPKSYEILDFKNIYPDINNYGMWRPYHTHWGKDGLLYMDLADRITVIDPNTLEHIRLFPDSQEVKFMTIAEDASGNENIYFADATDMGSLQMITVSDYVYPNAGIFKLSIPPVDIVQNEAVSVGLDVLKASNLYSFKAKVKYDPAVWDVVSVSGTDAWNNKGMLTWTNQNGVITIIGTQMNDSALNGDVRIATIEMVPKVKKDIATVTILAGSETISMDADESGLIFKLERDNTTIVGIGFMREDIDFNGVVDATDMMHISRQIGNALTDTSRHMDLNGNGEIDIADLGLVGLIVQQK